MSENKDSKRAKMLLDEDVRRWYDNLYRGSPNTAEVNLRRLSLFCELNGLSPEALAVLAKRQKKKAQDLMCDFVTRMERNEKSPGYISGIVKAVRSWLKHKDVDPGKPVKISNPGATPSIANERVPTQEELKTILIYSSERAKTSIALMALAGLRPETIGNESGKDGLVLRDLPEMKIENNTVRFEKVPTRVVVRPTLSKAKHKYFTFLPKEGCEYLAAYLEKRIAKGEELTPDSPVITVSPGYEHMGKSKRNGGSKFIGTRNVTREIREAIRPRFSWRPYVLRAYFDSQLLLAENHGKIISSYRTFFMGHRGDIEGRYTTHKGSLPDQMIEGMRESFEKCGEYMSTIPAGGMVNEEKIRSQSVLDFARFQGLSQERYELIQKAIREGEAPTVDKVMQLLKEDAANLSSSFSYRVAADNSKPPMPQSNGKPFQGKIVDDKEIVGYVEEGWQILKELRNGKFLIKRPNGIQH